MDRAAGAPTSFQVGQPERYRPRFSRPIKIGLPDAASIPEFGFTNPVLVDGENGIVAGHGRVLAARKLGMTEVPCIEIATAGRRLHSRAGVLEERRLAQKVRVPMLVLWGMRSGQGSLLEFDRILLALPTIDVAAPLGMQCPHRGRAAPQWNSGIGEASAKAGEQLFGRRA